MTPREFWAVARGHYLAENRRLQAEVAAHWYGAGFQRYKRLPDLNKVLRGLQEAGKPPKPMTSERARQIAEQMTRMYGGKDVRRGKPQPANQPDANPVKRTPRPPRRRPRKPKTKGA